MTKLHPLTEWRWAQRPPMSQAELGRRLGVSRSHINHIETGRRTVSDMLLATVKSLTKLPDKVLRPEKDRS